MKVRNHHILCVLCIGCAFVLSTCDTDRNLSPAYEDYFVKYYGEEGSQEGVDLVVNESDESVLLLGTTSQDQTSRLFLVKADWQGNVIWKRKLGGPNDIAKDLEVSNDGGYIILSETPGTAGDVDCKLIKITFDGIVTDSVVYGHPQQEGVYPNEFPVTVSAFGDGYMITGSTDRDTVHASAGVAENISDILYVRLTEDLDTLYSGVTSGGSTDYGVRSVKVSDEIFYVLGSSLAPGSNNFNFWFFPVNSNGVPATLSSGTFGDNNAGNQETLKAACPANFPGVFFVGTYTSDNNAEVNDIYIARANMDNDELKKVSNGSRIVVTRGNGERRKIEPVSVNQALFGTSGYLILGNEGESNARNIWVTRVDSEGVELWSASFGASGGNDDRGGAIAELPDGSVMVVGTVNIGDETILKMALFRISPEGKFAR